MIGSLHDKNGLSILVMQERQVSVLVIAHLIIGHTHQDDPASTRPAAACSLLFGPDPLHRTGHAYRPILSLPQALKHAYLICQQVVFSKQCQCKDGQVYVGVTLS